MRIQNIVSDLAESVNVFTINSIVLREKSQYRLFYTNIGAADSTQRGIIGTLRPNGFEWSETRGLEVTAIGSGFDNNGVEQYIMVILMAMFIYMTVVQTLMALIF